MFYKIEGKSIFGTCQTTPDGRAFDNEFRSEKPNDYILDADEQRKGEGAFALALMEHYGEKPKCEIITDFGKIEIYQSPVHNGLIVSRCTYQGGLYAVSPIFTNTVSPLAIVNYFMSIM